jgi:hypothetical protein
MMRWRNSLMVAAATGVVFFSLVCGPALGRDAKLTIHPQKAPAEPGKYALLLPPASLTEGDAVPLHDKAVKTLPDKKSDDQVLQYLKVPIDQMPTDQVEQLLKRYIEGFKYVAQAVKCRECKWPALTVGTQLNLDGYRKLVLALTLWARYEIAEGSQESAIVALRTGFGLAQHLVQGPGTAHFMYGATMAGGMRQGIEEWVQMEDTPNLFGILAALPRPFGDVEKAIESEKKALPSELPPGLKMTREQFGKQLQGSHDGIRTLAKRVDSDLALLQCVEALRWYAASHSGQLPQALSDITEVSVPKDPMTGAAFQYTRTGATAVLESPTLIAGEKKGNVRYEITVKN